MKMTPMAHRLREQHNHLPASELEMRITANLNNLSRIVHLASEAAVSQLSQYSMAYCVYQRLIQDQLEQRAPRLYQRIEHNLPYLDRSLPANTSANMVSLCHAYFTLRMLEACSDAFIHHHGRPLLDHDPSTANIVIHTLLGDDALRIDAQVDALTYCPDQLVRQYPAIATTRSTITRICQPWPCLSAKLGTPSQLL
ncbi:MULTISPECIES: hypothetical protein [unclassified Oceanobacter]|uniref:hypothetical protein n=1 Tax=unclassified Oceanobacter TaxID=2620260 RepID=UPI0026E2776A|nr:MULTISPECIES: hypothetical protein [unclassified Oceanobacter]MDO6680902.1 hypothetical protein [Oceanobacter sp. 5_MG-2023]MDP2504663.1 hypothetical protein [Oceanobacter sp. 3_MG-2023]MDP2546879.1 hypothetical protein [Oceanobacter sp. 4_MG-2023]